MTSPTSATRCTKPKRPQAAKPAAETLASRSRSEQAFMHPNVEESLQSGVKHILTEQGRIDAVVNAAGYGSYGALEDVPLAEARHQFEVNVFGAARLTQLVLPHMRAQRSGTIINITSMGGKIYVSRAVCNTG